MNLKEVSCEKTGKKSGRIAGYFNLPRFFNIFSICMILILTILLSLMFMIWQKRLILDYAIKTAKSYAHQLNHEIIKELEFNVVEKGNYLTLDKENFEYEKLDIIIKDFLKNYEDIIKMKIFDRSGVIVFSTDIVDVGDVTDSENFKLALENNISSELTRKMQPIKSDTTEMGKLYKQDLLEVYVPIISTVEHDYSQDQPYEKSSIVGVLEIYKDMSPLFLKIEKESYRISLFVMLSMGLLSFLLHIVVKRADKIIKTKNEEIEKHNKELEEAQKKITESIDQVIKNESFHVRYKNENLIKCWELKDCKKSDCPSYKSENLRCWQVAGTFCGSKVQGFFAQKYGDCRKCEVYTYAFRDLQTLQ
jgi:hypothetical protein